MSEDAVDAATHRRLAIDANNSVWELLDGHVHSPEEVDELLSRAYAAAYHWQRAADRGDRQDSAHGRPRTPHARTSRRRCRRHHTRQRQGQRAVP